VWDYRDPPPLIAYEFVGKTQPIVDIIIGFSSFLDILITDQSVLVVQSCYVLAPPPPPRHFPEWLSPSAQSPVVGADVIPLVGFYLLKRIFIQNYP
jgi:hypothetical protein